MFISPVFLSILWHFFDIFVLFRILIPAFHCTWKNPVSSLKLLGKSAAVAKAVIQSDLADGFICICQFTIRIHHSDILEIRLEIDSGVFFEHPGKIFRGIPERLGHFRKLQFLRIVFSHVCGNFLQSIQAAAVSQIFYMNLCHAVIVYQKIHNLVIQRSCTKFIPGFSFFIYLV